MYRKVYLLTNWFEPDPNPLTLGAISVERESQDDDEISLVEMLKRLRSFVSTTVSQRRLFRLPLMLCVAFGFLIAFGSTEEYSAYSRLVPYRSGGGTPGLSGLATLAGVRLPTNSGTDIVITTDLYPEVASTFDFQASVALTPVVFSGSDSLIAAANYFTRHRRASLVGAAIKYIVGLPQSLLSVRDSVPVESLTSRRTAPPKGPKRVDPEFRSVVLEVGRRIRVNVDKRTGIISIYATMPDPVAAADLARATSERLMETVMAYEVRKADEQLRYVDQQYWQSKIRYDSAQRALAEFMDRNRALVSATAQIESSRLKRDEEIAFDVFQQFVREREQARIKRNQDTPVFTVLEQPTVPTERSSPRRTQILLMSIVIGLVAGVGRVWWRSLKVL